MTDRVPGAPGQYKAVITETERQKMQAGEQFTITMTRDDQPIIEGTPYSKTAVLPDELAQKLCPNVEDPTPAQALSALFAKEALTEKLVMSYADKNPAPNDLLEVWLDGNRDAPVMQPGYIATEDSSAIVNSPVTSGPFYAVRTVEYSPVGHVTVRLNESYPANGRIWSNMHDINVGWRGWVENYSANKLPLSGGTMTGPVNMNGHNVTGLGAPGADGDATPKWYVDNLNANKLSLTGGDMSGPINMNGQSIFGVGTPSAEHSAVPKWYVDKAFTARIYQAFGWFLNAGDSDVKGSGTATVTIEPTGLARIDFNLKIFQAGTKDDVYLWGINRNMLVERNPNIPTIAPMSGGTLAIYDSNGALIHDLVGHGGFMDAHYEYWTPARVYNMDGSFGKWEESKMQEGYQLVGTCFGTVQL